MQQSSNGGNGKRTTARPRRQRAADGGGRTCGNTTAAEVPLGPMTTPSAGAQFSLKADCTAGAITTREPLTLAVIWLVQSGGGCLDGGRGFGGAYTRVATAAR